VLSHQPVPVKDRRIESPRAVRPKRDALTGSPLARHAASPRDLKERLDAERNGLPFLLFRNADDEQVIHTIGPDVTRLTLGRSPENDVCLDWDQAVSVVHAELQCMSGTWIVIDDGLSRNGTFVNGQRLSGRRILKDTDELRLGDTTIAYRAPEESGFQSTVIAASIPERPAISDAQRRVLVALCRPFKHSDAYAMPATNQQIADELFLSVDAVKTHLRALFQRFALESLPQNQKRLRLVELAFQSGVISDAEL
jgi:hypothetical protein